MSVAALVEVEVEEEEEEEEEGEERGDLQERGWVRDKGREGEWRGMIRVECRFWWRIKVFVQYMYMHRVHIYLFFFHLCK